MDPTVVARSRNRRSNRHLKQMSSRAGDLFATPPSSPDTMATITPERVTSLESATESAPWLLDDDVGTDSTPYLQDTTTNTSNLFLDERTGHSLPIFTDEDNTTATTATSPKVTPLFSARNLQERIAAEQERILSKKDRLLSNRNLALYEDNATASNTITPLSLTPSSSQEDVFSDPPAESCMLLQQENHDRINNIYVNNIESFDEENCDHNSDGWKDARSELSSPTSDPARSPSPSEYRAVQSTKIQPLSTKRRPSHPARPCPCRYLCCAFLVLAAVLGTIIFLSVKTVLLQHELNAVKNTNKSSTTTPTLPPKSCQLKTNILSECSCVDQLSSSNAIHDEVLFNRDLVLDFFLQAGIIDQSNNIFNVDDDKNILSCHVQNQALLWVSDLNHHVSVPPSNLAIVQRYVLAILYQSLSGRDWYISSSSSSNQNNTTTPVLATAWLNASLHECEWLGITCSGASERIISIDLADQNLHGTLPNEVPRVLQSLRHLQLQNNPSLTVPLGMVLKNNLPLLETLDISNTNSGVGSAATVTTPIVSSLTLTEFRASNAKLSGSLEWWTLSSRLRHLDLSNNQLTGPAFPTSLTSWITEDLEVLNLSHNQLTGALPSVLGPSLEPSLLWNEYLTTLLLHDNPGIVGPMPLEPYSRFLSFLDFSNTAMTGTVPLEYCSSLPKLDSLVVVACGSGGDNTDSTSSSPPLLLNDYNCSCCMCP